MTNLPIKAIGMAWYEEQHYARLRSLFTDGNKLHATFLQWQDAAEHGRKRYVRQGYVVVKAYIDPDTFPVWCTAHGHNVDAQGRMAFANAEAVRVLRESGQLPG